MTSINDRATLIKELEEFYEKLRQYTDLKEAEAESRGDTGSAAKKREALRNELLRESGRLRGILGDLVIQRFGISRDLYQSAFEKDLYWGGEAITALGYLMDHINQKIGTLQAEPELEKFFKATPSLESPKAFIAHGGETVALRKLEDFLRALGVEPLIVEKQPSGGKALNDKVEHYLGQADCAIILGTKDDEIDGKFYPRQNVTHEIGLAQKTLGDRVIYLLEEGAQFSSNIWPKVHERFTHESMDKALTAVARELKEFRIIKAVKP